MEVYESADTDPRSEMRVRFESCRQAMMVKSALEIDEELQPSRIERMMSVDGCVLLM